MHGPALAGTQRRTTRRRPRSRTLENGLPGYRTSWSRTHRGTRGRSGGTCSRRARPQGCFVYRTRPGLGHDHSRRRRYRRCGRDRSGWSGSHGRRLGRRSRWPRCRSGRRYAASREWRGRRRSGRSRRCRRRRRCRLRRSWYWSGKAWPRCRSRYNQLRRCRRPGGRCGRRRRRGRDRGLDGRWRNRARSFHGRGRLLLADDGL